MITKHIVSLKLVPALILALLSINPSHGSDKNVMSDLAQLKLKPAKCVSLHQGQVCYANVELSWKVNSTDNYCLYSNTQSTPLRCWENVSVGQYEGEISANTNVIFTLSKQTDTLPLARAEMKMAWVYKKKRNSVSWRVF